MKLDFEISKINKKIKETKVKYVVLQLPDGLKPYALDIARQIKGAIPLIWTGSNFGGCDILPINMSNTLWVNFGHAPYNKIH